MKQVGKTALVALVLLALAFEGHAQCSMCRAVAESEFNSLAEGLNNGILYLMGIPYLLLVGSAFYLFRKPKN